MNQMMTKYLLMPQFVLLLPCPYSKQRAKSMKVLKLCCSFYSPSSYHVPYSAINLLIKFMFALFCILSRISPFVRILQKSFPPSFHVMRKRLAGECLFSKYPVCPKCHKIYESSDSCVETIGTRKSSKY